MPKGRTGRAIIALLLALYAWRGRDGAHAETKLQPSQIRNWSQVARPVHDPLDSRRNQTRASMGQIAMDADFLAAVEQARAMWEVAVIEGREWYAPEVQASTLIGSYPVPPHVGAGVVCVYADRPFVVYCTEIQP